MVKKRVLETILTGALAGTMLIGSQSVDAQNLRQRQEIAVGLNALVGGAIAGIGSHRNEGSFWKGFACGATGGTLTGLAKSLVGTNENYAWQARTINGIGTSMITNCASNEPMLSRVGMTVGPVYFEFDSEKKNVRPYLDVVTTGGIVYNLASGARFDSKLSVKTGSFVFTKKEPFVGTGHAIGNALFVNWQNDSSFNHRPTYEGAFIEKIVYDEQMASAYSTIRHEILHTLQAEESRSLAPLYRTKGEKDFDYKMRSVGLMTDGLFGLTYTLPSLALPQNLRPQEIEAHGLAKKVVSHVVTTTSYPPEETLFIIVESDENYDFLKLCFGFDFLSNFLVKNGFIDDKRQEKFINHVGFF